MHFALRARTLRGGLHHRSPGPSRSFRDLVREFLNRHLVPNEEKFIEQRYIDREIWLEAGADGYLGLEIPKQYGGSAAGDYRFNARASRVCSGACRASPRCTSVSDGRCRE